MRSATAQIDRVLIWSVCRIGKSLPDLVSFMEMCRTAGVAVFMHEQGIDTETSNGMSMLDLTAMMALHLRQSRRDRILRGQAAARSLSIRFGRPPIPTAKIEKAKHIPGDGQGSSRGGEVGRWDQPVIRLANRGVPAFNRRSLTRKAVSDLQYPMNLSG